MLAEMSVDDFIGWLAYWNLEPFGPMREDDRAGEIAAVIANVHRDDRKRPFPFNRTEFFPRITALLTEASREAAEAEFGATLSGNLLV